MPEHLEKTSLLSPWTVRYCPMSMLKLLSCLLIVLPSVLACFMMDHSGQWGLLKKSSEGTQMSSVMDNHGQTKNVFGLV